jgi:hypothetical protein
MQPFLKPISNNFRVTMKCLAVVVFIKIAKKCFLTLLFLKARISLGLSERGREK